MRDKRLKNKNGVTLIALIITIIVLLILAGVSISLVAGDNGVLNKAVDSAEETNRANVQSELEMAVSAVHADWSAEKYVNGNNVKLVDYLTKARVEANMDTEKFTLTAFAVNTTNGVTVTYKGKEYLFTVKITSSGNSAKVSYESSGTSKTWTQNEDGTITDGEVTLSIGDYVNYDAVTGATTTTYTSSADANGYGDQVFNLSSYTAGWRVLGIENGHILLISADTIGTGVDSYYPNSDYYLKGQAGYQNAETELQNICDLYGQGTYATGARSITIEDINEITGYNPNNVGVKDPEQTGSGTKYESGEIWEYGNEVTYTRNSDGKIYYQGTITPTTQTSCSFTQFIYLKDGLWHDLETNESVTLKSTAYWYYTNTLTYNYDESDTTGLTSDSTLFKILFSKTGDMYDWDNGTWDESWNTEDPFYYYYLGSRFIGSYDGYACFGVRFVWGNIIASTHGSLCASGSTSSGGGCNGVRPLVSLQSNIQLTKNEDGSWDISK